MVALAVALGAAGLFGVLLVGGAVASWLHSAVGDGARSAPPIAGAAVPPGVAARGTFELAPDRPPRSTATADRRSLASPGHSVDAQLAALIGAMTPAEVDELIRGLAGQEPESFEAVTDRRRFAERLALLGRRDGPPDSEVQRGLPVRFGTRLRHVPAVANEGDSDSPVFSSRSTRIFGVFPMAPGDEIGAFVKWVRVDAPEVLLFAPAPVHEQDGQGFVRLDRSEGWPAGRYRLEVYRASDGLDLLASGEYRTEGTGRPLVGVFE